MANGSSPRPSGYRVGDITIDLARHRVSRHHQEIELGKLSYKLLVALARSAPAVLTPDDLIEQVWDGRFVNPPTIKQRIVLLRQALGDDAGDPAYLRVVRGQGYAVIPPVEKLYGAADPGPRRFGFRVATLLAVVLLGAGYLAFMVSTPPDGPLSVAVLPFENLSPEPEDSYFAAGLYEEIIDRLDRIDGLKVVSRQAVSRLSDSPTAATDLAQALDIDTVLHCSVYYQDGRVRIRARLVNPETGVQLWSKSYERDFSNIFEIQYDIATSVAGALGVKLGVRESNAFRGSGTANIDAYEAFLAGLHVLGKAQGQDRAIAFFKRATELDPDYAAAWAQMGFAIASTSFYSPPERTAAILDRAMPYLSHAVELDPHSARAAAVLGFVRYARLDWIGGAKEHERAIGLHPGSNTLSYHAGLLVRAGRVAAAQSELDAAESIEPLSRQPGLMQVQIRLAEGRYQEARELAMREDIPILRQRLLLNVALNEGDASVIKDAVSGMLAVEAASKPFFARLLSAFDSPGAALGVISAFHADRSVRWPAKQHDIALIAAYFGDLDLAMTSMTEEASLSTVRLWALWYPLMADVRQLPEFKELVTDLNLVAYWRAYGWPDVCRPVGEADFRCS